MKKHYTYNITNILIAKAYLGVRSCNTDPVDDLGVKYFSSSSDKDFLQDQKDFPERFLYNVIEEFDTRESASYREIELHEMFDVGNSKDFYNKTKATLISFGNYGMITAFNIKENKSGLWPKEDFIINRDNYICSGEGKVAAFNIKENRSGSWPKEDFDNDRDNYICASDCMLTAFSIKENKFGQWSKKIIESNRDNYLHSCSNAYKLLIDPTFIPLPLNDKDYQRCFDRDTLGIVNFLKTDAKNRDKERFPSATGPGEKSTTIRSKRKLIPSKYLPDPIVWSQ